jgi:hypothetical protein
MKNLVLDLVESQGDQMASVGFFEGKLASMWAEIAIAETQEDQTTPLFWQLRVNLGMIEN